MGRHTHTRAFVAAVVAAALASAGCLNPHLNPFPAYPQYQYPYPYPPPTHPPADKSATPPTDNRTADPVKPVQHQTVAEKPAAPPPATPSTPLPLPTPLPPAPANPAPPAPPVTPPGGAAAPNPNQQRKDPTLYGEKLPLGPNELPLDRALEIIKRLDDLIDENKRLQARIRTLEANGLSREDSIKEMVREVEKAMDEVVKARGDIQGLRAEVNALRAKVKQAEDNELETLKTVIAALKRILQAEEEK